jgi:hypothetical protein
VFGKRKISCGARGRQKTLHRSSPLLNITPTYTAKTILGGEETLYLPLEGIYCGTSSDVWAYGNRQLLKSDDYGSTWVDVGKNFQYDNFVVKGLISQKQLILAFVKHGQETLVFQSENKGKQWDAISKLPECLQLVVRATDFLVVA